MLMMFKSKARQVSKIKQLKALPTRVWNIDTGCSRIYCSKYISSSNKVLMDALIIKYRNRDDALTLFFCFVRCRLEYMPH